MAFPSPATNGQRYEAGGYIYQYSSAKRTWTKVAVSANTITTTPAVSTNTVTSSNVTANAVTVGNVSLTGNGLTTGNVSLTPNGVSVGNVTLTSNAVTVGNVSLTANALTTGNTSVSDNGVSVGNVTLTSNGLTTGNTTLTGNGLSVGNVSLTSNGITTGNTTITANAVSVGNVSLTSNGLSVGNVSLSSNGLSVGNVSLTDNGLSVGNVTLTGNGLSVGNVSLTGNSISVGNVSLTENAISVGNVTLSEAGVSVGNTSISDNAITTETVTANTVTQSNAETGTTTTMTSGVLTLSNALSNTTTTITSNSITSPTFYGNLVGSFLGTVAQVESLSNFTTSNLAEGSNLYFTNTRVVYALTAGNGVNIAANGMITVFGAGVGGNVTSVNELVGDVSLKTANIPESSSNLYFTNARAVAAFVAGPGISINANGYIVSTATGSGGNGSANTAFTVQNTPVSSFFSVRTTSSAGSNTLPITRTSGYGDGDDWFSAGQGIRVGGYTYEIMSIADGSEPNGNATLTLDPVLFAEAASGTAIDSITQYSNDVNRIVVGSGITLVSSGNTATISVGSGGGAIVEYVNGQTGNVQLTTANIPEYQSNLYFTNTRVVYALTAGNGVNITANGMITVFGAGVGGNVTSVNQLVGDISLETANIPESASNLYFTNTRAVSAFIAGPGLSLASNGYLALGSINTDTVTEGSNLYFSNTRAVSALTGGSGLVIEANGLIFTTVSSSVTQTNTQSNTSVVLEPSTGLTQSNASSGVSTSINSSNVALANSQSNTSVTIQTTGVAQSNTTAGTNSTISSSVVGLSNSLSNTSVTIESSGVAQSNTTSGTSSTISSSSVGLANTQSNTTVTIQSGGVAQSNTSAGTNSTISSSVVGLSNTLSNTSVSIQSSGVAQSNTTAGTNSTISSSVVGLSNTLSNTTVTIQSSGVAQSNADSGTSSSISSSAVGLANTQSNTTVTIQSSGVAQSNTSAGTNSTISSSVVGLSNSISNTSVTIAAGGVSQNNQTTGTVSTINSSTVSLSNTLSNTTVELNSNVGLTQSNTTSGTSATYGSGSVSLSNTLSNATVSLQAGTGLVQSNTNTGTTTVVGSGNVALTNTQSGSAVTVTSDGITLSNALTGQSFTFSSNFNTSNVSEGANLYFTNARAVRAFTAGSGLVLAPNGLIISTVSTSVQQTNVESNTTVSLNPSTGLVQSNAASGSVSIIGSGNVVLQNTIVNVNITIEANGVFQNNVTAGTVSNIDSTGATFTNTQAGVSTIITSNSVTSPSFIGNLIGTVSTLSNFTTSNLAEGSNLYFTNTRAIGAFTGGSGIVIASNGLIVANVATVAGALTTDNIAEGANLYFTNSRAIGAFTAGSALEIAANGLITVFGAGTSNITSVNGLTGDVNLSTANITESGNLYFTNTRVVYALTAGNGVNITANGMITVFGAGVGGNVTSVNQLVGDISLETANIPESTSNLYFTNTRAIQAFTSGPGIIISSNGYIQVNVSGSGGSSSNVTSVNGANGDVVLTTANIAESGNLYFTNSRAIQAFTAGSGITIAANGLIISSGTPASNAIDSVNGQTGNVVLTTTNINEGSNLYFTNSRAVSALTGGSGIVIASNGLILSTVSTQVAQSNTQTGSNVVLQPSTGLTQSNTQSNTTTTLNSGSLAIACTQVSVNINLGGLFQNNLTSGTVSVVGTSSIGISNSFTGTSVSIQPGNGLIQSSTTTGTSTIVSSSNVALNNTTSGSSVTFTSDGITLANSQTGQIITISSNLNTSNILEGANLYFTNARVYSNVTALGYSTNTYVNNRLLTKANVADLNTSNVVEGSNLYFTNTRAVYAFTGGSGVTIASNGRITVSVSGAGGVTSVGGQTNVVSNAQLACSIITSGVLNTSNVIEGGNLYFTNSRTIAAFTSGSGISIAANGRITAFGPVTGNVTSVNGLFGEVNLDTGNVFENGNLYFTNARVYSNIIQIGFATTSYVNSELANLVSSAPSTLNTLSELAAALGNDASFATTVTNSIATKASNAFVIDQLNLKANISSLTTDGITEGTNLFFTNTRAIGALTSGSGISIASNGRITSTVVGGVSSVNGQTGAVSLTTASIPELTNLYFTNSRSRAAFTAGQNIAIAANGRITANVSAISGNYDFGTFLAPATQRFRLRRGLESERTTFVPLEGELIYVTDTKRVYVGDGSTAGGILVGGAELGYDGGAPETILFDTTLDGGFFDTTSFDDSFDAGSP